MTEKEIRRKEKELEERLKMYKKQPEPEGLAKQVMDYAKETGNTCVYIEVNGIGFLKNVLVGNAGDLSKGLVKTITEVIKRVPMNMRKELAFTVVDKILECVEDDD